MVIIKRLHNQYLVPEDSPFPQDVRSACEAAIQASLPQTLGTALEASLRADDSTVWCIRKLDADFPINTEVQSREISHVWAREITAAVTGVLKADDNPDVVSFPDRSVFLAHFLIDLADGSAWSKWFYMAFEGLRMLPVSAALRTAICEAADIGLQALCCLSDAQCGAIIQAISAADARRVLNALASARTNSDEAACFQAIIETWRMSTCSLNDERRAILLFIGVSRTRPDLGGESLRNAAAAVAHLTTQLQDASDAGEICMALRNADLPALYRIVGFEKASVLSRLFICDAKQLDELLHLAAGNVNKQPDARKEIRFTAFGGMFLLLPLLDELPLTEATSEWPEIETASQDAIVRLLILAKCFGTSRARGCLHDPLVRDLMGVGPAISDEQIASWLLSLKRRHLRIFSDRIDKFFAERLESIDERELAPSRSLRFLALPRDICRARNVDRVLGGAAAGVLRLFVRKLFGFSHSSLEYLHANFLDCTAAVEETPKERVVCLSRAPLHLIVGMAGLNRCNYQVSWLDEKQFAIYPEG